MQIVTSLIALSLHHRNFRTAVTTNKGAYKKTVSTELAPVCVNASVRGRPQGVERISPNVDLTVNESTHHPFASTRISTHTQPITGSQSEE